MKCPAGSCRVIRSLHRLKHLAAKSTMMKTMDGRFNCSIGGVMVIRTVYEHVSFVSCLVEVRKAARPSNLMSGQTSDECESTMEEEIAGTEMVKILRKSRASSCIVHASSFCAKNQPPRDPQLVLDFEKICSNIKPTEPNGNQGPRGVCLEEEDEHEELIKMTREVLQHHRGEASPVGLHLIFIYYFHIILAYLSCASKKTTWIQLLQPARIWGASSEIRRLLFIESYNQSLAISFFSETNSKIQQSKEFNF